MANAILLVLSFIAIWVLRLLGVQRFNKWLILLYILPLSALSVFIFIACVKKRADIISLSIAGWLTALCVFLSLKSISGIGYIFILMAGIQILMLLILLIINAYVKSRGKRKSEQLFSKFSTCIKVANGNRNNNFKFSHIKSKNRAITRFLCFTQ